MASVHNSVVSTIVLMLISKRELDPLATFRAFVKIEMQMAPFMDRRQPRLNSFRSSSPMLRAMISFMISVLPA